MLDLRLALRDPAGTAVYLAHPCQFIFSSGCSTAIWTNRQFSPESIQASNRAINQLKSRHRARKPILVGYSGGDAVAAFLAAQHDDVVHLITVAGNRGSSAWTEMHRISPLTGSLNPDQAWRELVGIR